MIPDPATIARRRHTVTIVVRFLIVLYGVWCCYNVATGPIGSILNTLANLSNNAGMVGSLLVGHVTAYMSLLSEFALLAALIWQEKRLVRWIVPIGDSDQLCSKCGYSLKDLKSPICPECGTNLPS